MARRGANNHLLVSIAQALGVQSDTFGAGLDPVFAAGGLSVWSRKRIAGPRGALCLGFLQLLAGFALGLAGAGAGASLMAPRVASNSAPARIAKAAPVVSPRALRAEAPEPPPVILPNLPPATPEPPRASAAPSASAVTTFDAELELISLAKSALDAHRLQQARAWLAQHAQRFPHGVFAVERDALSVLASCEQGPKNPALAQQFATQHPGSPLVERLERACSATAADNRTSPRAWIFRNQ